MVELTDAEYVAIPVDEAGTHVLEIPNKITRIELLNAQQGMVQAWNISEQDDQKSFSAEMPHTRTGVHYVAVYFGDHRIVKPLIRQ